MAKTIFLSTITLIFYTLSIAGFGGVFIELAVYICSIFALYTFVLQIFDDWTRIIRELGEARTRATIHLMQGAKGLNNVQASIVSRHDLPEGVGRVGSGGVHWIVRGVGGDIPLACIEDYLRASIETMPYFHPTRDPGKFRMLWGRYGINAEKMLPIIANSFVAWGYAEDARSNLTYSITGNYTIDALAVLFRVDIRSE